MRPGALKLRGRATVALLLALAASMPATALACSVCGAVSEPTKRAYLTTTILLSAIPLAMIGGFLYWLKRASRMRDDADLSPGP
jgi:hypothetical protein